MGNATDPAAARRWTRREWLRGIGGGAAGLALARCLPRDRGARAIVIGSGFGGSIAALRLGQAGIPTTVLERGRRWPVTPRGDTFSPTLTPDRRSTWLRERSVAPLGLDLAIERYVGVLERVDHPGMQVYTGAAVGGGSIVYGGMTVAPSRRFFSQIFPSDLSSDEFEQVYFPRVREMLHTSKVPADLLAEDIYRAARVSRQHSAAAGLSTELIEQACDWDVVRAELGGAAVPSAIIGDLLYGANSGYKNSLDRTYLPLAEATGRVEIRPEHRVDTIRTVPGGYAVDVTRIDDAGESVRSETLTCRYLFLAAGSLGTTELLLRARARGHLRNLDSSVGRGWGSNGNSMFLRSIEESTGEMQANPPVLATLDFDNPVLPALVEQAPFPIGFDCHCLLGLAVVFDDTRGHFEYDAASDRAVLRWPEGGSPRQVAATADFVRRLNEANGGTLGSPFLPEITQHFTYHPLGGAVLGQATDLYGRVLGHEHLYVIDGALIPGSAGCANPSLLIAALAERNIERILATDIR